VDGSNHLRNARVIGSIPDGRLAAQPLSCGADYLLGTAGVAKDDSDLDPIRREPAFKQLITD